LFTPDSALRDSAVTPSAIEGRILHIRGVSNMLDTDLAALYQVSAGTLLQAVKRNRKRLPRDFLFQLTNQELTNLPGMEAAATETGPSPSRRRHALQRPA
jgi:ORF6N domain